MVSFHYNVIAHSTNLINMNCTGRIDRQLWRQCHAKPFPYPTDFLNSIWILIWIMSIVIYLFFRYLIVYLNYYLFNGICCDSFLVCMCLYKRRLLCEMCCNIVFYLLLVFCINCDIHSLLLQNIILIPCQRLCCCHYCPWNNSECLFQIEDAMLMFDKQTNRHRGKFNYIHCIRLHPFTFLKV